MADEVISDQSEQIKPRRRDPGGAFMDMCAARRDFLRSLRRFMAEFHDPVAHEIEVEGTISVLRQMLDFDWSREK